jgi:hypothetical protein
MVVLTDNKMILIRGQSDVDRLTSHLWQAIGGAIQGVYTV